MSIFDDLRSSIREGPCRDKRLVDWIVEYEAWHKRQGYEFFRIKILLTIQITYHTSWFGFKIEVRSSLRMQVWFGFEVWFEFKMFENGWLDQSWQRALSIGHVSFLEGKVQTARSCFKSKFIRIIKMFIVIPDSSSHVFKIYSNPFIHGSRKYYPTTIVSSK